MRIQGRRLISGSAAFGLAFVLGGSALADGYRNPPPTAEGIGKSGANSVFVDDASAISYNPANLAFQSNKSAVVSATFAKTDNSYYNPLNPAGSVDSQNGWVMLPNLYYSMPTGYKDIAIGLGITTPYGQGIEWAATDVFNPGAPASIYKAKLALVDFNPTIAFKVTDNIAIGLGADIYYSDLKFDALTTTGGPPTGAATADGTDVGYGGNIGISWQVTDAQRAVFTYRSEVNVDHDGDLNASGIPLVDSSFGLEITFPNTLSVGYGVELTDDIRVECDIEWLEWSSTQSQVANLGANGSLTIPQNWDDTFTFNLGGDWQLDENWVVRAGYAFIESPIPNSTISPLLPDADRHALSLGVGYATGAHTVDVAYTFSIYDDRGMTASGTYDIDSDLVGLTYSYSF